MTNQEWDQAYKDAADGWAGLLAAIRTAHDEQTAIPDDDHRVTDIGELASSFDRHDGTTPPHVRKLLTRAVEIFKESQP